MPEKPRQFAVLHHVFSPQVQHWDLLLDIGDVLATWQLFDDPHLLGETSEETAIRARRIQDHRRDYLDYEGPVSGNRGNVTRLDRGNYVLLQRDTNSWTIQISGSVLAGKYQLTNTKQDEEDGEFKRLP